MAKTGVQEQKSSFISDLDWSRKGRAMVMNA